MKFFFKGTQLVVQALVEPRVFSFQFHLLRVHLVLRVPRGDTQLGLAGERESWRKVLGEAAPKPSLGEIGLAGASTILVKESSYLTI